MYKRLLIVFLILMVFVGGIAYYLFNKKVEGLENAKAIYSLTADELYNAFEADEQAALQKYEGKVIEVRGEVLNKEENDQFVTVTLRAENAMIGGVNCSFNNLKMDAKIGDELKIKGRCQGFLMNVILTNCVVVNE